MGIKKTYGIFNESAEKAEKLLKIKVYTVLWDTLYNGKIWFVANQWPKKE